MQNKKGYVSFVLHAHLPFIHHPESDDYLEESWLYEAISETYIPLLTNFQKLVDEAGRNESTNLRYYLSDTYDNLFGVSYDSFDGNYSKSLLFENAGGNEIFSPGDSQYDKYFEATINNAQKEQELWIDGELYIIRKKDNDFTINLKNKWNYKSKIKND